MDGWMDGVCNDDECLSHLFGCRVPQESEIPLELALDHYLEIESLGTD